jgi:hypothetical protein
MNGFYDLTPCPNKCSRFTVSPLTVQPVKTLVIIRQQTVKVIIFEKIFIPGHFELIKLLTILSIIFPHAGARF